jgi:hypothetical protein
LYITLKKQQKYFLPFFCARSLSLSLSFAFFGFLSLLSPSSLLSVHSHGFHPYPLPREDEATLHGFLGRLLFGFTYFNIYFFFLARRRTRLSKGECLFRVTRISEGEGKEEEENLQGRRSGERLRIPIPAFCFFESCCLKNFLKKQTPVPRSPLDRRMSDPTSCAIKCYNCKCPMYHHQSSNQACFRCASICASQQCTTALYTCLECQRQMGDTSWQEVHSWTEWRDSGGRVVSSDKDSQAAGQACGQLCILTMFGVAQIFQCGMAGIAWLISSPGWCWFPFLFHFSSFVSSLLPLHSLFFVFSSRILTPFFFFPSRRFRPLLL